MTVSLVPCPACNNKVSTQAESCPKCGHKYPGGSSMATVVVPPSPQMIDKEEHWLWTILMVLVALAPMLFLIWLFWLLGSD